MVKLNLVDNNFRQAFLILIRLNQATVGVSVFLKESVLLKEPDGSFRITVGYHPPDAAISVFYSRLSFIDK